MNSKRTNVIDLDQKRGGGFKFIVSGIVLLVCVACLAAMLFTNGFAAENSDDNGNNANISNGQIAAVVGAIDSNTTTTVTDPNSIDPAEADSATNTQQNSESANEDAYANGENNTNSAGAFAGGSTCATEEEKPNDQITINAAFPSDILKAYGSTVHFCLYDEESAQKGISYKQVELFKTGDTYDGMEVYSGVLERTDKDIADCVRTDLMCHPADDWSNLFGMMKFSEVFPVANNMIGISDNDYANWGTYSWKEYTPPVSVEYEAKFDMDGGTLTNTQVAVVTNEGWVPNDDCTQFTKNFKSGTSWEEISKAWTNIYPTKDGKTATGWTNSGTAITQDTTYKAIYDEVTINAAFPEGFVEKYGGQVFCSLYINGKDKTFELSKMSGKLEDKVLYSSVLQLTDDEKTSCTGCIIVCRDESWSNHFAMQNYSEPLPKSKNFVATSDNDYSWSWGTFYWKEYTPPLLSYTVTFDGNGGDPATQTKTVKEGETVEKPSPDPTKTDYLFESWCTDPELTTEYNFTTPVYSSFTLYAKYSKIKDKGTSGGTEWVITENNKMVVTVPASSTDPTIDPDALPWEKYRDSVEEIKIAEGVIAPLSTENMFKDCVKLQSISIPSSFDAGITTMSGMFNGCSSLEALVLPSGFGRAATTMKAMFANCSSLKSVDLSGMDTRGISQAGSFEEKDSVFYGCNNLSTIKIGENWTFNGAGEERLEGLDFPDAPKNIKYTGKWKNEKGERYIASQVTDGEGTWSWEEAKAEPHTVKFDVDGGTPQPEVQIVNHGEKAVEPQMPLKEGYTFIGWIAYGEEPLIFNFNNPIYEDYELHAWWWEQEKTYEVIGTSAENNTYVIGSATPYIITVNCASGNFVYLTIDGIKVETSNYEVNVPGNDSTNEDVTILTLKPEYLDTLNVGSHNIRFNYYDGKADTVINIVENKGGGDTPSVTPTNNSTTDNAADSGSSATSSTSDFNFALLGALLVALSVAAAIVLRTYKRINNR